MKEVMPYLNEQEKNRNELREMEMDAAVVSHCAVSDSHNHFILFE